MTVTLATAAGVPQIVVTTPCDAYGKVNSALLYALGEAGAHEVYKVGGAQALGALAYGTATIKPVIKVFGPGNAYVMEAKRQVFGSVSVDLLPGPSEVLVLADETANPAFIAADTLAQAQQHPVSLVGPVTPTRGRGSDCCVATVKEGGSAMARSNVEDGRVAVSGQVVDMRRGNGRVDQAAAYGRRTAELDSNG